MARATGLEPAASGVTGRANSLKRLAQEHFSEAERAARTVKVSPAPATTALDACTVAFGAYLERDVPRAALCVPMAAGAFDRGAASCASPITIHLLRVHTRLPKAPCKEKAAQKEWPQGVQSQRPRNQKAR